MQRLRKTALVEGMSSGTRIWRLPFMSLAELNFYTSDISGVDLAFSGKKRIEVHWALVISGQSHYIKYFNIECTQLVFKDELNLEVYYPDRTLNIPVFLTVAGGRQEARVRVSEIKNNPVTITKSLSLPYDEYMTINVVNFDNLVLDTSITVKEVEVCLSSKEINLYVGDL